MKRKILIILSAIFILSITSLITIGIARWQIALKKEDQMNKTRYKVTLVSDGNNVAVYDNLEIDSYIYLPYVDHATKYFTGWYQNSTLYKGTNNELAFEVSVSTIVGSSSNTEFTLTARLEDVPDGNVLFKVKYNSNVIKQVLVSKSETKFYMFNINVPDKQSSLKLTKFTTSSVINHYDYFGDANNTTNVNLNDYFVLNDLSNKQIIELIAVYE